MKHKEELDNLIYKNRLESIATQDNSVQFDNGEFKIQGRKLRYYYLLLLKIYPNPDYVILLEGDSKVIYNRKEEISEYHISSAIKYYKEYLLTNKISHSVIDTTKNDITSTYNIAMGRLKQYLK